MHAWVVMANEAPVHQQLAPESHLQVHTAAEALLQMVAVRQTRISQLLWSAQPLPQQPQKGTPESPIRSFA